MNFDRSSFENRQQPSPETIREHCRNLEVDIRTATENLQRLEGLYRNISGLEMARTRVSNGTSRIDEKRNQLKNWPRGVFGIKDKKKYESLSSEIQKLEEERERDNEWLQRSQSAVGEESRPALEIEREKKIIAEKVASLKFDRRKTGIKLYEKFGESALEEALELYRDRFFGPEEVNSVFGIDLKPEDIPPLPLKDKLEQANKIADNILLVLKIEKDKPAEWKIFPSRVVRETVFKDYVEETRGIREFLKKHNLISQEELDETSDEILNELAGLMKTDEKGTFEQLVNMRINKSHRHSIEDMIYFVRLIRGEADDTKYTRDSNSPHTTGFRRQTILDDSFESTTTFTEDKRGVWVKRIGKFTDPRAGGYLKETNKPNSKETAGWGTHYETGVRVMIS